MVQPVDSELVIEGEGPPLLLVHGIGASKTSWAALMQHFRSDFRCIAYDIRGHGETPKGEGPLGLDALVADLEALRARLGIERAAVVGHALGGMVAAGYARHFPDRVNAVGLVSTPAFRNPEDRAKVRAVLAAMRETGIAEVLDTMSSRWFTEQCQRERPDWIEARKQQVLQTDPEVFLDAFHLYAETEMAPWLHEVSAPALVLTGEDDAGSPPRLAGRIAATMPHAELVILDGLKHALLIEGTARVARAVGDFLKRYNA